MNPSCDSDEELRSFVHGGSEFVSYCATAERRKAGTDSYESDFHGGAGNGVM